MNVYLFDTDTFSEYLNEDTLPESEAPITRRIATLAAGIACAVVGTGTPASVLPQSRIPTAESILRSLFIAVSVVYYTHDEDRRPRQWHPLS